MNIKLTDLQVSEEEENALAKGYLYKDLMLDLSYKYAYTGTLHKKQKINDIQALYDIEAIKASLRNIFLSSPGDKILNPEFGLDLRQFLFEPVNITYADVIMRRILEDSYEMDERIQFDDVEVIANEDEQEYLITMAISVPTLSVKNLSIKAELSSSNGLTIL